MRSVVFTGTSVVEMLDVEEPSAQEGEVLVDVAAVGICGSELHGIREPGFRVPPLVMGHEFAGTTPDGRRVVVNPILSCSSCDLCLGGQPQVCRTRSVVGIHRAGGFAERVAVPADALHEIPESLSWEEAAMVEPLANAVHAWGLGGARKGASVGIIGSGTIGLVCLLVAKDRGASHITVTDLSPERLSLATRLGADEVASELSGEFDVVFDAVGAGVTRRASVDRLRPGGTAVWIGLLADVVDFDGRDLIRQEKKVVGSFAYTDAEFVEAIELASRVDLGWCDTFPLEEGARVFTELMNGRTDIVKALLRP